MDENKIVLIDKIIEIIKDVPFLDRGYMCHNEWHTYTVLDYDAIKAKLYDLFATLPASNSDTAQDIILPDIEEAIEEAKSLHSSIYNTDCCSPSDIMRLAALLNEIEKAGYESKELCYLEFVKIEDDGTD